MHASIARANSGPLGKHNATLSLGPRFGNSPKNRKAFASMIGNSTSQNSLTREWLNDLRLSTPANAGFSAAFVLHVGNADVKDVNSLRHIRATS
mmetsp:Transcript_26267/g.39073  ORF Transcript_26267/g.39073 Transcript_26267/m.39073 type:complete len:94 (+) Transcript_26267:42-323(+)